MANDSDLLSQISDLVEEERSLREQRQEGDVDPGTEIHRLQAIEVQLDRCWDLLRQRRAKSEFGADPDEAQVRPAGEVEGYLG